MSDLELAVDHFDNICDGCVKMSKYFYIVYILTDCQKLTYKTEDPQVFLQGQTEAEGGGCGCGYS